ncbi:MAG: Tfx family DNA-binding protein [Nitrososphaerota archaeon]
MKKLVKPFLTEKQIKALRLRMSGMTQDQVAEVLKISREAVANLEKRAYMNVMRARQTLKVLEGMDLSDEVIILAGTPLTDVPRRVLDQADILGIKLVLGAEAIYQLVKRKARKRGDHLAAPIRIKIFNNGKIKLTPS